LGIAFRLPGTAADLETDNEDKNKKLNRITFDQAAVDSENKTICPSFPTGKRI